MWCPTWLSASIRLEGGGCYRGRQGRKIFLASYWPSAPTRGEKQVPGPPVCKDLGSVFLLPDHSMSSPLADHLVSLDWLGCQQWSYTDVTTNIAMPEL